MLVRFKVNLGSRDADEIGLEFAKCGAGMLLNVSDKVGAWLVSNGHATESPAEVKGVSDAPSIADSTEPTIKAESKPTPVAAKKSTPSHKES